jgi:hypothetical protein
MGLRSSSFVDVEGSVERWVGGRAGIGEGERRSGASRLGKGGRKSGMCDGGRQPAVRARLRAGEDGLETGDKGRGGVGGLRVDGGSGGSVGTCAGGTSTSMLSGWVLIGVDFGGNTTSSSIASSSSSSSSSSSGYPSSGMGAYVRAIASSRSSRKPSARAAAS